MSTTQVAVTGHGPLSFFDSNGSQRVVPLSAVVLSDSQLAVEPDSWLPLFGTDQPFSLADEVTLLAVAAARLASGELMPPPLTAPAPALSFQAAVPGTAGNNVSVVVATGAGTVFTAKVNLTVAETDVYPGLADGPAARAALGVDENPGAGDTLGTGLVSVKASGANLAGTLPKAQTLAVKGPTDVVAEDGSTVVFTLVPRTGVPAAGVTVTIAAGASPSTVDLTASFQAAKATTGMYPSLGPFSDDLTWLITPPSSAAAALPASGTVQLSGGAPGVAATGTAYTG